MKILIKTLLILLPIVAIGQNKTYLGFEIGPKFEIYQYEDNGDALYTRPFFFSPVYGLTLGQELNKTLSLETGFYINDYGESYRIEGDWGYSSSNAFLAYQIPLRLKARLDLVRERLSLAGTVGYTLGFNNDFGSAGAGAAFSASSNGEYNDSTRTQHISNYSFNRVFGLIETGVALDYTMKNSLSLYLSANYLAGLNRMVELDVSYWINDEPEQTATVYSNGNYYSIVFGVRYPISNLWTR